MKKPPPFPSFTEMRRRYAEWNANVLLEIAQQKTQAISGPNAALAEWFGRR